MRLVLGILAILAIVIAVAAILALVVRAMVRDRGKHGTSGSLSSAMLEVQSILEPGKKKVVETMHEQEERKEDDTID